MILKDLIVEGARTAISCRHRGRMGFDTMGESVERETEIEDGDGDEGEEREEEEEEEKREREHCTRASKWTKYLPFYYQQSDIF